MGGALARDIARAGERMGGGAANGPEVILTAPSIQGAEAVSFA